MPLPTTRFLGLWALPVAFAAGFAGVRGYALAFRPELLGDPEGTVVGRVVAVNGFHVHHFYFGAAIALAALGVLAVRRRADFPTLAALGVALALVVDEVGLVASGFTEYNHPWRTPIALATAAGLALAAWLGSRATRA